MAFPLLPSSSARPEAWPVGDDLNNDVAAVALSLRHDAAGWRKPHRLAAARRCTQVCLTQAIIDKYGAPLPQTRNDCQLVNVQKSDHGMTADLVCVGRMTGKGTLTSSWDDPLEHAKGGVHFTG